MVADKRKSGFQEVVSKIMQNISSRPQATQADLLITRILQPRGEVGGRGEGRGGRGGGHTS